jgi:hypothetical protein
MIPEKQEMNYSGMTGSVTYEGRLGGFIPLKELCSRLHIGKQTTFDLGRFKKDMFRNQILDSQAS